MNTQRFNDHEGKKIFSFIKLKWCFNTSQSQKTNNGLGRLSVALMTKQLLIPNIHNLPKNQ